MTDNPKSLDNLVKAAFYAGHEATRPDYDDPSTPEDIAEAFDEFLKEWHGFAEPKPEFVPRAPYVAPASQIVRKRKVSSPRFQTGSEGGCYS